MQNEKHYEVVAAVILKTESDGTEKIFCAKRPGPKPGKELNETNYKWEFPGGKIESGENREQALSREIYEEFGAKINVKNFITTVNHEYKTFSITMHAFFCELSTPQEKLVLKEHLESTWLKKQELNKLDWAPADIPIAQIIQKK